MLEVGWRGEVIELECGWAGVGGVAGAGGRCHLGDASPRVIISGFSTKV